MKIEGLDELIGEVTQIEEKLSFDGMELSRQCALEGMEVAKIYYENALKDGIDDGEFTIEKNSGDNGYSFIANGREPVFVEFGAGVYYNASNHYPIPKPQEIKNIGEYGKGMGKRRTWGYRGKLTGKVHITRGTPMRMPMYNASRYIEENIEKIAKEVFK